MTYPDICSSNKCLYAELEHLTLLIAYATVHECLDDIETLTKQRDGIHGLININLEELDKYWEIMAVKATHARRRQNYEVLTGKERKIVDMYISDPKIPIEDIAHKFHCSFGIANRIIAQYLTKKYSDVA